MKTAATTLAFMLPLALATAIPVSALASGEACTAAQKSGAEKTVQQLEDAERAKKTLDAYTGARNIRAIECAMNGYKRRDAVLERTSKILAADAEKAGRNGEAFDYYRAPHTAGRADYSLADADRALLKHVKANAGDYKVVSEAARWFEQHGNQSNLRETRAVAKDSGEKTLATEEKAFATRQLSMPELEKARDWLEIVGEGKRALARADQRGDTLLGQGAFSQVERAFDYYNFSGNQQKRKNAEARARKLGDEHAGQGQARIAAQFYDLAGDTGKSDALMKKIDAQSEKSEKSEGKRQDQFKKDQQSLEKALGL